MRGTKAVRREEGGKGGTKILELDATGALLGPQGKGETVLEAWSTG